MSDSSSPSSSSSSSGYEITELVKAVWDIPDDDKDKALKLIADGANTEQIVNSDFYDHKQAATALGWALMAWCSPELIRALIFEGNAYVTTTIAMDDEEGTPHEETLPEWLRRWKEACFEGPAEERENTAGFQVEYWGRGPTKDWFASVERILNEAGALGAEAT
jgi:hypothetical protein